jgi:hypothetical protein
MLIDLVKPAAFLLLILALYAVFHTAFLIPATTFEDRILDSLALLLPAAGISLAAGLLFRDTEPTPQPRQQGTDPTKRDAPTHRTPLSATLPIRLFCWTTTAMVVLFILSWYLETHTVLYREVRF